MGLLKWFNKSTYRGLGEVFGDIRKELQALQPVDSADITWNKTSEGIQAIIRDKATTSSSTQSAEDGITTVVDSAYDGFHQLSIPPDRPNTLRIGADKYNDSLNSPVLVNTLHMEMPTTYITLEKKEYVYVVIHFYIDGSTAKLEYILTDDIRDTVVRLDNYFIIGRVLYADSAYTVKQDFVSEAKTQNGIPQIWYLTQLT